MKEQNLMTKEITDLYMKKKIAIIILVTSIICIGFYVPIISLIGSIVYLYMLNKKRMSIEINDNTEEYDLVQRILKSKRFYEITKADRQNYSKDSGYISSLIKRKKCKPNKKILFPFTNTDGIVFKCKKYHCTLYFIQDSLIVFKGFKVYRINYKDLDLYTSNQPFVERDKVSKDSQIVGYHYQHSNKDGSADARYSKNKSWPIVNYGTLNIKLDENTIIQYIYSNIDI